jgi:hypothetical protein
MTFEEIDHLRAHHPAWSLLRSQNVALVMSFLSRVFIDRNVADVPAGDLAEELDDELYALNQRLGEERFPRTAAEYLGEWAAPERGWLRKFYPPGSDEARYDISPAVEKGLMWVADLRSREFIGTESRLNTIFDLLHQMVYGAEEDPERRLAELHRRRAEIDEEIARAERGEIVRLDAVRQRDRFQQFSRMARELLADFRQVEENFRRLDRNLRERTAGWTGSKGALLDDAVGSRNSIAESDQGRSFQAFYDFLLSHQRQTELTDLLDRLHEIEEIGEVDERLAHIHFDWIDACERTQATVRLLSEQLRRFLDDQVWLENRRVFDLLRNIEAKALAVRHSLDSAPTMEMDDTSITVGLPMERPMHRRPSEVSLESADVAVGSEEFDSSALLGQTHIDRAQLAGSVWEALGPQEQVGLRAVLANSPLQQGLAELVGYLSLAEPGIAVVFDGEHRDQLSWSAEDKEVEIERVADLPRVSFTRDRMGGQ